jgi:uncharacterized protein YodC (DUF2158 family)
MIKFQIGDIVCLTTGSGPMRVVNIYGTRLVECEWEGKENRTYKHYFRPDSLLLYKDEQKSENFFEKSFRKKD